MIVQWLMVKISKQGDVSLEELKIRKYEGVKVKWWKYSFLFYLFVISAVIICYYALRKSIQLAFLFHFEKGGLFEKSMYPDF